MAKIAALMVEGVVFKVIENILVPGLFSPPLIYVSLPVSIAIAVALWSPELKAVAKSLLPSQESEAAGIVAEPQVATQILSEELQALVPVIERQIWLHQPVTLSNASILPLLMSFPGESRSDHLKLTAILDALHIPSPPDDASRDDWYYYLIRLKVFALDGDLEGAREL